MINKFRRLLIRIGKVLPFLICFFTCLNYSETILSLITNNLIIWNDIVIPNARISFFVGRYFEYNAQTLFILAVISVAIETCIYNKLACVYLIVNILEKSYFDFKLEPTTIYIICVANIIASGYLTYKGLKTLFLIN